MTDLKLVEVVPPAPKKKPWYLSKPVIAGLVGIALAAAGAAGANVAGLNADQVATGLMEIIDAVFAIVG